MVAGYWFFIAGFWIVDYLDLISMIIKHQVSSIKYRASSIKFPVIDFIMKNKKTGDIQMAEQSLTFKDAIKVAIKEEIKAYNLYMETSKKVSGSGTKKMLEELAEMEKGHRKLLEGVIERQKSDILGKNIPRQSPGIADFLVEVELKQNATPQDVMIFAMKAEEKAFNFYTELKGQFSGTELENLFNSLVEEEKGHKIKLENEYDEYILREN
ncbi:ferritin family protein [candidate division KSB1 bacterium]|nr:ferritin family protein [candidate division KSB1 bacterium]MBL7092449.1 ferritin family protein [candidate division KSB1 bacterium]